MNSENNLDQNESGHSGFINGNVNFVECKLCL